MTTQWQRGRKPILSDADRVRLRMESDKHTAKEWSGLLRVNVATIYSYCTYNGFKLKRKEREKKEKPVREPVIRRFMTNADFMNTINGTGKMVRPPAKYDNRSQQDVIDHYLKLEI